MKIILCMLMSLVLFATPAIAAKFPYSLAWVKSEAGGQVTMTLTISNGNAILKCTSAFTMADTVPARLFLQRMMQEASSCMFDDFTGADLPSTGTLEVTPQELAVYPANISLD